MTNFIFFCLSKLNEKTPRPFQQCFKDLIVLCEQHVYSVMEKINLIFSLNYYLINTVNVKIEVELLLQNYKALLLRFL